MPSKTQFFSYHQTHSKLGEFAGFMMPLWYTTTSEEHMAVREKSGFFDVSHMGRVSVVGQGASRYLERLVPTKVEGQPVGRAFYTLLLNEEAGIIDDMIIVKQSDSEYMVVVNAANKETDLKHMLSLEHPDAALTDLTAGTAMVAIQGPEAQKVLQPVTNLDLGTVRRFRSSPATILESECLVSRTGYTGEDGFEVIIYGAGMQDPDKALRMWNYLTEHSTPCGLAARDSLRLEAGLPLHGTDIDQKTDPFEADLSWVLTPGKTGYMGSEAILAKSRRPPGSVRIGLVLDRGIPRLGFDVSDDAGSRIGNVTSGTFSPLLKKGIALCRVLNEESQAGTRVSVRVRESSEKGSLVKPPFYGPAYGWNRTR